MQVVGTATMFMWPAPMIMKQGYMIAIGIVMAFLFTGIPEWTIWVPLLAMALYDIVAVLVPNGPLKVNPPPPPSLSLIMCEIEYCS